MKSSSSAAIAIGVTCVVGASVAYACLLRDPDQSVGSRSSAGASRSSASSTGRPNPATPPQRTAPPRAGKSKQTGLVLTPVVGATGAATAAHVAPGHTVTALGAPGAANTSFAGSGAEGAADGESAGNAAPHAVSRTLTPEQHKRLAEALASVDWDRALKDLVGAARAAKVSGHKADLDTIVEATEVRLALAKASQALGLTSPTAALGDPEVRSVIVPSWLDALGVRLAPAQGTAIAAACLSLAPASPDSTGSALEARQSAIRSRAALEQSFAQVLTPEQMDTYARNVADDPLMKGTAPLADLHARNADQLVPMVTSYWVSSFKLGRSARKAAGVAAAQLVASVLAVAPVDPSLEPAAARAAELDRVNQLVGLQKQAEQTLAGDPALTAKERARVAAGSGACLRLALGK